MQTASCRAKSPHLCRTRQLVMYRLGDIRQREKGASGGQSGALLVAVARGGALTDYSRPAAMVDYYTETDETKPLLPAIFSWRQVCRLRDARIDACPGLLDAGA